MMESNDTEDLNKVYVGIKNKILENNKVFMYY